MIREAKRKHGISNRYCKRANSDLNLTTRLQTESKPNHPCIQLGMYIVNKIVLLEIYFTYFNFYFQRSCFVRKYLY